MYGVCPKCHRYGKLTKHHIYRSAVWHPYRQNKKKCLCRDCHDSLEKRITAAENEVLRQYPELYTRVLNDFLYPRKENGRIIKSSPKSNNK